MTSESKQTDRFILFGLLFLAFLVRLPGPISTPALGQTDAYTHLQFLRDMASRGELRHSFYPFGFYLLAALPVRLLGLDPYLVARFAGLFFGPVLVWSVHKVISRIDSNRSAHWAALLIAGFPLFYLLQKTGLGLHPIQLGLALLPWILLAWWRLLEGSIPAMASFSILGVLLGLSNPMMLVDLVPFLAGHLCWRIARGGIPASVAVFIGFASACLGIAPTLLYHQAGGDSFFHTLELLTRTDLDGVSLPAALWASGLEFIRPKRFLPLDALPLTASLLSFSVLVGFIRWSRNRAPAAAWFSSWTLYAWAQSVFACFQFPGYFRAGWTFLLGAAVVGGFWMTTVQPILPKVLQRTTIAILAAGVLSQIRLYPRVRPYLSPCESGLVRFAREELQRQQIQPAPQQKIWSRKWNTFPDHLGDILHALWEGSPVTFEVLSLQDVQHLDFDPSFQHLVLLDDQADQDLKLGAMAMVDPELHREHLRNLEQLLDISRALRAKVESLPRGKWTVSERRTQDGLDVLHIRMAPQPK